MTRFAALLLLIAGCDSTPDPCAGATGTCLTVEVVGSAPPLDTITFSIVGRSLSSDATSPAGGTFTLPVRFAAFLPDGLSGGFNVAALGKRGGVTLAEGSAGVSLPPFKQRVRITLSPLAGDLGATDAACMPSCAAACGRASGCGTTLVCGPPCGTLSQLTPSSAHVTPPRAYMATASSGSYRYLVGGEDGTGPTQRTVQVASMQPDGTLGPFADTSPLATARSGPAVAIAGGSLYVAGGFLPAVTGANPITPTVERGAIAGDGTVTGFADAGVALNVERALAGGIVLGPYFYVVGGISSTAILGSIERARIGSTGGLSAFTVVAQLGHPRLNPMLVATASQLYVMGGSDGSVALKSIEQAPLNPDGSLGSFSDASIALNLERNGATASLVGNHVLVMGGAYGGFDAGAVMFPTSIETATVDGTGMLGSFSPLAGVGLQVGRQGHATVVTDWQLTVLGGFTATGVTDSIEQATLQ
jgi:hypothetical protein